jgi:hypothetical protein
MKLADDTVLSVYPSLKVRACNVLVDVRRNGLV